jgi:hypothetical protein
MSNKYKTGDPCPKSGIWLRIEDNEKIPMEKDDPFPPYYIKTGKVESGASIYSDEPKRALLWRHESHRNSLDQLDL